MQLYLPLFGGMAAGTISKTAPPIIDSQQELAERVGFEPTVRLPAQRLSSSKILMLARAVP